MIQPPGIIETAETIAYRKSPWAWLMVNVSVYVQSKAAWVTGFTLDRADAEEVVGAALVVAIFAAYERCKRG